MARTSTQNSARHGRVRNGFSPSSSFSIIFCDQISRSRFDPLERSRRIQKKTGRKRKKSEKKIKKIKKKEKRNGGPAESSKRNQRGPVAEI